ncbi:MAG: zinc-dependent alcohol dehydrogenase family protein [Armatimonadetes bacterium]|nr:zinc-dependent alcohol dehydrogenase family protein [Armatimonadota bacterium]
MKAAIFEAARTLAVRTDRPVPEIGPEDILVRVHTCGVCGTDMHIFEGEFRVKFPVVAGHEFSGEVVEVGPEVPKASGLKVGDKVAMDPNIPCGHCRYCRKGKTQFCENLLSLGVMIDGGFEEFARVPFRQAYRLPERLSLEEGAFVEPLACCVHGIDRAAIQPGEDVVILGAGPIGLMQLQLARLAGAGRVWVSEPQTARRQLALSLGADDAFDPTAGDLRERILALTGVGADLAIECAGLPQTAEQAMGLVCRGGKAMLFGVAHEAAKAFFRPYEVFLNELTVFGSFINPFTHSRALDMLASGRVKVRLLISHRLPIERLEEALALSRSEGSLKVMVGG